MEESSKIILTSLCIIRSFFFYFLMQRKGVFISVINCATDVKYKKILSLLNDNVILIVPLKGLYIAWW